MLGTEQEQNSLNEQDTDIDALFASVYNDVVKGKVADVKDEQKSATPEETPDEAVEEVVAEDKAAPAADTSNQQEDPLKDIPESVRNYLRQKEQEAEEARRREAEWRQKYKSDEGRQAALQRKTQELERLLREKTQHQPNQEQKLKIEETEEWKALSDSDPVLAKVLRGIAEESTRQAEEKAEARIKAATEPLYQERESSLQEREQQRLLQMVPDLPLIVKDQNYHDWFDRQPESIRRMAESVSADDNFTVIRLFAMDRPDLFPAPQQQTVQGGSVTPAPQVDKLAQERQRKAQSQGVSSKIVTPPSEVDERTLFEQIYKKTLNKR